MSKDNKNKFKREIIILDQYARIEFVPNSKGGLKNSYLRIEDGNGRYVGSIDGKVNLRNLHRITGDMLSAFPKRKIAKKK